MSRTRTPFWLPLRQLLRIAGATALEGLQQPVALLLAITAATLTALGPLVTLFTFGEEGRLARDSGLALQLVLGLFVVAFTAGATVHDELRRGTAAAVLAKPVGRGTFLVGKWLGVVAVLLLFSATTTLATLLAERTAEHFIETRNMLGTLTDVYSGLGSLAAIALALAVAAALNFARRVRFAMAAQLLMPALLAATLVACGFVTRAGTAPEGGFDLQVNLRVVPAAALVAALLALYAAIAATLSTRLRAAPTAAVLGAFLFLGFFAESIAERAGVLAAPVGAIVPDVQNFWMTDALAGGGAIPARHLARVLLLTLTASAFWLLLGRVSLDRKDLD